ncbi:HisG-domain-containing protein [Pseudovirgaria hyperparasitica]|uniref:ATP phosphoribosyltransferase n=1 Tax=Pseudovirgaria hyperparasitica TaxID=470096 RepID=A0A6A6W2R6_9PEZI|nr:HisG-domain-containing protein [Pseudovirgaria hyperparasitica]KAF2757228.1 HisG-domain-containing protein [Pseudovirgaria hyperparasitica]
MQSQMDSIHSSLNERLLFAVPKKGRLNEASLELLKGSDIQFHRHSRLDIALVKNLPIALVFLPAADIPTFVGEGRVDLGITGRDQVAEHAASEPPTPTTGVEEVLDLEFGRCKLQVQVPKNGPFQTVESLVGRNVVTSFTNLAEEFFARIEAQIDAKEQGTAVADTTKTSEARKLRTHIKYVGGSVEAACALGVADGIVDLVESGETMRAAGLHEIATVKETTAILVKSKQPAHPELIERIVKRIEGVITAQKYVLCTYNIPRRDLAIAKRITPGKRSPTVTSLEPVDGEDWVAIQAMVLRSKIAVVMDDLAAKGAVDIIITKIDNTRATTHDPNGRSGSISSPTAPFAEAQGSSVFAAVGGVVNGGQE